MGRRVWVPARVRNPIWKFESSARHKTRSDFALGIWVTTNRQRKNSLPADRIDKLESLSGWAWDAIEAKWLVGFACTSSAKVLFLGISSAEYCRKFDCGESGSSSPACHPQEESKTTGIEGKGSSDLRARYPAGAPRLPYLSI